jgi:hypothetical protein
MRKLSKTLAITSSTALAVSALFSLSPSASAASSGYEGCPSGAVCLYPDASFDHDPTYTWYSYGAHNISNQYGMHRIFNNQTGGAIARNCTGYDGRGCQGAQAANTYADYDYTPYNSVLLAAN